MLQIRIPGEEFWNEKAEEFVSGPDTVISLEHSLISISKWESMWHKPFLSNTRLKGKELLDYIKCMTITSNISDDVYNRLTTENIDEILKYINDPMTATTINEHDSEKRKRKSEAVTSELIYYWMVSMQIPFECQKWHINRLMMLIRICGIKNQPDKKMSKRSVMQQNAALNAARRQKLHSRG